MSRPRVSLAALRWRAMAPYRYPLERFARAQRYGAHGTVALTFDDGPHPDSTDLVLDELAAVNAPATFFCVGKNALAHPELVHRMRREGHAVGSHSFDHPDPRTLSSPDIARQYDEGRAALREVLGEDITLFRPPHGHLSWRTASVLRGRGLRTWLWDVDPQDWRPGVTTAEICASTAFARSGSVVLLHDWVEQPLAPEARDRSATVRAIPQVVAQLRHSGLTLRALGP